MAERLQPVLPRQWAPVCTGGVLLGAGGLLLAKFLGAGSPISWAGWSLVPAGLWVGLLWRRISHRVRTEQVVRSRLARLPAEFTVLNGLVIPAPWGTARIDHLIVSRFGIVVVANGPCSDWMLAQVEAVRSLLVSEGLAPVSAPVKPLVVIAPGVPDSALAESDAPVVRVEQIRLGHVAPSNETILHPNQVKAIVNHFLRCT